MVPGMQRSHVRRWWFLYLIGAMAFSFVAAYVVFFTPESEAELGLDPTPASAPVDPDDLSGEWHPGAGSVAGYRVREKLSILPAPNDAVGRTSEITGTIQIEDGGDQITALAGSAIETDMSSIHSDEERRDERMRAFALQTDTFPTATFALTDDLSLPTVLRDGKKISIDATGDLTLHGVTQNVTIPLEVRLSGKEVEVAGSYEVTMSDYGIDVNVFGGFVSIESTGTMEFVLTLTR